MKRLAAILPLLLLLAALFGCGSRTRVSARLDALDTLVTEHPDSVLAVLSSLSVDSLTGDEERAHYGLLLTMAHDKLYHPHTSDSLMVRVSDYYDRHGSSHERALAHFYLASVCRDLGRQPDMLRHLLRAEFYGEDGDDANLLSMIYCNEGYVYYWNDFYEECDSAFFRAQRLAEVRGDTLLVAEMLCQRSANLLRQGRNEEALEMLAQADSVAQKSDCLMLHGRLWCFFSKYYNQLGDREHLLESSRMSLSLTPADQIHPVQYLMLGQAHYLYANMDSAEFYFQKAVSFDPRVTASAYMKLADVCRKNGDVEHANEYERLYSSELEKLKKMRKEIKLAEAMREEEEWKNMQERQHLWRLSILAALSVVLLALIAYFVVRRRMRRKDRLAELEKLRRSQLSETRERELSQLEKELSWRSEKIDFLKSHLIQHSDIIERLSSVDSSAERFVRLTDAEWERLAVALDEYDENFVSRLRSSYPSLDEQDVRMCMLQRLHLTNRQMAIVFVLQPQSVTKRKQRLKKILAPGENDVRSFDEIVSEI